MSDGRQGGPGPAAVIAIGSIISVAFMGSVVVTPLYQAKFGFSEIVDAKPVRVTRSFLAAPERYLGLLPEE